MIWKQYFTVHKEQLLTVIVLLTTSLIAYGTLGSTIISSDDWTYIVEMYVFGNLSPINLDDRRPLALTFYFAMTSIFGLRVEYYYFVNFLIIFLSAYLVYMIVKRVFPNLGWFASLVALTYLVYPVDYTRTWIIMSYIRFWWLVSLGVIWLLLEFVESGNKWKYILAMIGIIIPLGAYEGQFGITLLAIALIAFLIPRTPTKRKLTLLGSVLTIGLSFFIWRIYIQPKFLEVKDTYVGAIQFSPAVIIDRYLQGFDVFIKGWFAPIQAQLELSGFNIINWTLLYIIICCVATLWLFSKTTLIARLQFNQKISMMKSYFITFMTGGAFWIAGYIPIIGLYTPSLRGVTSRVNLYAVFGASLLIVSAVAILATLVSRTTFQLHFLTTAFILPLLIAGIFVQLQLNKENQIAWETQKNIWNGIFETISGIRDEKKIVVIIPGFERLRPFASYPFISGWEIDAGTKVLYNNPDIGGYYFFKDTQSPENHFLKNGFRPIPTNKVVSYKKLIFLSYDPQSKTVELVDNLTEAMSLPFEVNNYNPYENIAPAQPSTEDFRWLVK